jgi:hypothetical protein
MSGVPRQRNALRRRRALQLATAPLLGLLAALLVSCGSASNKLIPVANANPLQSDFQEVAEKAETGNGTCGATEKALLKTEQDFNALPGTTDAGLRKRLSEGIANLRQRALTACQQSLQQTTGATTGTTQTQTTSTATTPTQTTPPTTTTPPPTTTTPPPTTTTPETGGVPPEVEKEKEKAAGDGNGSGGQEGGK